VTARRATDRTPKPCLHKRADHQHGTHACYVLDLCRCGPCASANSGYERDRKRRNAYGRSNLIPAEPARQHVAALMAQGMGWKRIADTAGVAASVVCKLMYGQRTRGAGPSRRIRKDNAQSLLAVTFSLAPGANTCGIGTARRIQALVTRGWSMSRLAHRIDLLPANFIRLATGSADVTVATAERVRALYEDLWNTPPPESEQRERIAASRARNHAQRLGWAPPLAWDDDAIDDPTAKPAHRLTGRQDYGLDHAAVERAMSGQRVHLRRPERWEVVRRLHAEGLNDAEISALAGLIPRTVLRDRQALGLPAAQLRQGDHSGRVA
jgi:hypothetical protein